MKFPKPKTSVKNLAIERMIIEGCDILLDVNQMFVRQGTLIQIIPPASGSSNRPTKSRLPIVGSAKTEKEKEAVRQCFLFSNHLIMTTRTQAGRLHLVEGTGKIDLANITLIEDPNEADYNKGETPDSPISTTSSAGSLSDVSLQSNVSTGVQQQKADHKRLGFKLLVDDVTNGTQHIIHLITPSKHEKAAWITDISQVNYI